MRTHTVLGRPVVATMGNSVSEAQIALLRRYFARGTVLYDGGENGRAAADRAALRLCRARLFTDIADLPDGERTPSRSRYCASSSTRRPEEVGWRGRHDQGGISAALASRLHDHRQLPALPLRRRGRDRGQPPHPRPAPLRRRRARGRGVGRGRRCGRSSGTASSRTPRCRSDLAWPPALPGQRGLFSRRECLSSPSPVDHPSQRCRRP